MHVSSSNTKLVICARSEISEAHQAPASTKAAGHHCPPMQHTKEVLISTDYNLEEALISTNQCLARLIVTFLVKFSLTLTGRQIPSSICLRTLQLNLEKMGACIL